MNRQLLLHKLEEILSLGKDSLQPDAKLDGFLEWDSMAFLSFIQLCDSRFHKKTTLSEINTFKTPNDIFKFLEI